MTGRQYPVRTLLGVTAAVCAAYAGYVLLSSDNYKTMEQSGRARSQDVVDELDREARVSTATYWGIDSPGAAQKEGK